MWKVLLLGAGLVARPMVSYLLERGIALTIASNTMERAEAMIAGHPDGAALDWSADDVQALDAMVAGHDLVISLLPAPMHPMVAEACLTHSKHLVTTSYVSPEMAAMGPRAEAAGVILLNELGADPGIDHMSAMKLIHGVKNRGGKVTSFRSYCGGIPAPDANNNPMGYKLSWSPLGALRAAKSSAHYLKNGHNVEIEAAYLFKTRHQLHFPEVGMLESYPNRDSLSYQALYGLEGIPTMFRGTLRYPGWSETMMRVVELGLLDESPRGGLAGLTWAELMAQLVGAPDAARIKERVASFLWLCPEDPIIQKLEWLDLFSDRKLPSDASSVIEGLAAVMQDKMMYAEGERDMIVMYHEFNAEFSDRIECLTSYLIEYGIPGGDSIMARMVSLPPAIAARLVLEGTIKARGVQIPVTPAIYEPVMAELANFGIEMKEKTSLL